jgi:hypothetical protein
MIYLLVSGIFFLVAGFYWSFRLLRQESEHRNARGVLQFTHYHGQELHQHQKAWASLFRTIGILLLIAAAIIYIVPFLIQG